MSARTRAGMTGLRFSPALLSRPRSAGLTVQTSLDHFAIVTYAVEPDRLRPLIDERFELDCITARDGSRKALVSAVPFLDRRFRLTRCPWPTWSFGQINYRAYVTDTETGEHVVWFFGTSLASPFAAVPRLAWKLPWHRARIDFDTTYAADHRRYTRYRFRSQSPGADAELELEDTGQAPEQLEGFDSLEAGLVLLTHPLRGYYFRRDGVLGSYSVWHDRLELTLGRATSARFDLFERLDLVRSGDLTSIHSVLIQPTTEFWIYLPPKVCAKR